MVRNSGNDSLFLPGSALGRDIDWLVDTGCSVTVISTRVFKEIPSHQRPKLRPYTRTLNQAGGDPLQVLGMADMTIKIGKQKLKHTIVIADCVDSGILGLDFLVEHGGQIDLKSGSVKLCGTSVPLNWQKQQTCCRVAVAETVLVKAGHRMIVETKAPHNLPSGDWLVEPIAKPLANDTLAVAKSLTTGGSESILIEVMNPTESDVVLYKDTQAATVEPVELFPEIRPISQGGEKPSGKNLVRSTKIAKNQAKLHPELEKLCEAVEYPLTEDENLAVRELLLRNKEAFKFQESPLGRTDLVKHDIVTTTQMPIKQRARRFPIHQREEGEKLVKEMLEQGVIEPSTSPWASPVVLVKKKSGETRFCIDYRKLNAISVKDAYPLPRIDDCLDALAGAKCFSTLDLASGYWQVGMTEEAKSKSAFVTNGGLFQWKVMPFGLCNAPSTFERLMEKVLAGLTWQICLVYLDDIIVYSKTVPEHMNRLEVIMQKFIKAGLKLKPKKCNLFRTQVPFLGHVVSADGVSTDPEKIEAVQKWTVPRDLTDVRSFLGLCSYYRKFVPKFSEIAKPLTKLTEKDQPFTWGSEQENAWLDLKQRLTTAPVLAYPDPSAEFILDTDASGYGIGAVLVQVQEGKERVIAYGSRSLTKEERRYCVTRRELLAIVYFLKQYRHYLYGQKFKVRTDHGALRWLMNFKDPQGQVARWLEVLGTYNFEVEHRPGLRHNNADALSRGPCRQCGMSDDCDTLDEDCKILTRGAAKKQSQETQPEPQPKSPPYVPWTGKGALSAENLKTAQKEDSILSKLYAWKEENLRPKWADISAEGRLLKSYWAQWDSIELENGLLWRRLSLSGKEARKQILIPDKLQNVVLEHLHNAVTAGHMGVRRTLAAVRQRFFWPGLRQSVDKWCAECAVCASRKNPPKKRKAPLQKYQLGEPMERVALDITGPWPVSQSGNRYTLVVSDYFTKWAEAYPIPDQEAKTIAEVFVNQFVARFGTPLLIHSDQGRNFESKLFKEMCNLLGVKKTRTVAFHPQSDGLVERLNRTIGTMLAAFVNENQRTWDKDLQVLMMAYRSTPHESTKLTPNQMMLGREVSMPLDIQIGIAPEMETKDETEYVEDLRLRLENAYTTARENLGESAKRQKHYYDLKALDEPFKVGDLVWLVNKSRRKGRCPKLQKKWLGPAIVEEKVNDVTYKIRVTKAESKVVHYDHLKPYLSREIPDWIPPLQARFIERQN